MNAASTSSNSSDIRKIGLSCAECRRSKLKCDRTFPCQSCIRRGCARICPEGTLAATKGNKVLMAHAQKLSEQVKSLTLRVRELEAALRTKSNDDTGGTQLLPALTFDTEVAFEDDLCNMFNAIGSLSLGQDGQARYHGESAGAEYLQDLFPLSDNEKSLIKPSSNFDLPPEIIALTSAFPLGLRNSSYVNSIFTPYLPTRKRAIELASIYYTTVAWMYDPVVHEDFVANVLDPIYGACDHPSADTLHSHRLSLFFIVLAHGMLYDSHPYPDNLEKTYYILARAAFSLEPIVNEATSATVQALFLIVCFIYNSDPAGKEERWLLTGMCARIAQMTGLQRDSAGWNLCPEEVQRRRRVFWELFVWESWTSLVNGRPGALMVQHTDCKFADDLKPLVRASGEIELGFHAWKFRYAATCLSVSSQHVFSARMPPYSALLEIDKTIRKFPIPSHLHSPAQSSELGRPWSGDPSQALQQYCALCLRDSNLLYIHRSYFAQAIRQESENPLRHKYAPSVIAVYQSACRLISSLRGLYPGCPRVRYVWYFWSGIFSSCVVLGALVVESPGCTFAQDALRELEMTLPFYEEGSSPCRPPATLTTLKNIYKRAFSVYAAFKHGLGVTRTKVSSDPGEPGELEILGGRKFVITIKSNSNSPAISKADYGANGGGSPGSQFGTPELLMEYYEQLDNHPSASEDLEMDENNAASGNVYPLVPGALENTRTTEHFGHQSTTSHTSTPTPPPIAVRFDPAHPSYGQADQRTALGSFDPEPSHHGDIHPSHISREAIAFEKSATPPRNFPGQCQNQAAIWSSFMSEFGTQT